MSLSSRVQLGGSALIESGQLVRNRPAVAVLASCVQTRLHSPLSLEPRSCFVWLQGSTGSNALHVVHQ